jgi:hypothetical protein
MSWLHGHGASPEICFHYFVHIFLQIREGQGECRGGDALFRHQRLFNRLFLLLQFITMRWEADHEWWVGKGNRKCHHTEASGPTLSDISFVLITTILLLSNIRSAKVLRCDGFRPRDSQFNPLLISTGMQFSFVTVVSKYMNFAAFLKDY